MNESPNCETAPSCQPSKPADGIEPLSLDRPEKRRTYHHASGAKWVLENVTHFLARPSGTHRLKTGDGRYWVVPAEVVRASVIELEMEAFSV
jgi:hypothetical protein